MIEADFTRALGELMPDWDIKAVSDVEYLPGGYSNRNYAFTYADRRYVLRIPQGRQPFVDRTHEAAWYARLPPGVAPSPLALDTVSGVMLTPWVNGQLLVDAWPQLTAADLITYLLNLHAVIPEDHRAYDLQSLMASYQSDGQEIEAPAWQSHYLITCHNDLNPWNVLVTNDGWITLDWEFVGLNDPLFDLVSLHQGLQLPADELMAFASLYADKAELEMRLPKAERAFWLREYGWADYQISIGNAREEIRQQKDMAQAALSRL